MARKLAAGVFLGALAATGFTSSALADDNFEFGGYFRAGTGGASKGGEQACFRANGAATKYRLGNECEIYGEWALRYYPWRGENGSFFKINSLMQMKTPQDNNWDQLHTELATFWAQGTNLFSEGAFAGTTWWAGKRFYRRYDVHMTDFYFWRGGGQVGGGIEDLDLGFGKLAFAYLKNATDQAVPPTSPVFDGLGDPTDNTVQSPLDETDRANQADTPFTETWSKLDAEFYGINVNPNGELKIGVQAYLKGSNNNDGDSGWFLNLMHFQNGFLGGFNQLTLQFANGAAAYMSDGGVSGLDDDDKRWRVVDQLVFEPSPNWSGQFTFVYEDTDIGDSDQTWYSVGARPVYHFSDHVHLAVEAGWDFVDFDKGQNASLQKITISPYLSPSRGYWSRPQIRAFFTYAQWNDDDGQNAVIGADANDNWAGEDSGWTYGVQAEAWW